MSCSNDASLFIQGRAGKKNVKFIDNPVLDWVVLFTPQVGVYLPTAEIFKNNFLLILSFIVNALIFVLEH